MNTDKFKLEIGDLFGLGKILKITMNTSLVFATILLFGDCLGCIDTVEIIKAVKTPVQVSDCAPSGE